MITIAHAYLALAAAVAITLAALAARHAPHTLHAAGPVLVAAVWAIALWAARRRRAALYHRHGRRHGKTRLARARAALARARTLRLTTTGGTA